MGWLGGRRVGGAVPRPVPYTAHVIGVLPPTFPLPGNPTGFVPATMWRVPSDPDTAEIGTVSGRCNQRSFDNGIGKAVSDHRLDGEGMGSAQIGTRHAGRQHVPWDEVSGTAVYPQVVAPRTNAQTPGAQQTRATATERLPQLGHGHILARQASTQSCWLRGDQGTPAQDPVTGGWPQSSDPMPPERGR